MTEALIITTAARDDRQLDMSIQLGPERTEKALRQAAKLVSKKARIPGFRPGKAPYAKILSMFGRDALLSEVLDDIGQKVFQEAIEQEKIEPYALAGLDDVQMDPVTFRLVIPLQPEVNLGDYRSVRLEAPAVNVTAEDVETLLEGIRSERGVLETVARAAQVGDTVVLDIKGTVGEESIMDNQDWELVLKSETGWLPGFDEAFVGMTAGEDKQFSLTYPEDSASRYRGQEATFAATLKEVQANTLPDLDDEFAKTLGDYEDMAGVRAQLLKNMTEQRTAEAESQFNNEAIAALVERATMSYPPVAVDDVAHQMLHELEDQLRNSGYSLKDFLRLQSKTPEQYQQEIRPQAENRLKGRLVLHELITLEKIEVTDVDHAAELGRMTEAAEDEEQASALRELFESDQGRLYIEQDLLTKKAFARLREIVTGQAPELPVVEGEVSAPVDVTDNDAVDGEKRPEAESADAADAQPAPDVEPATDTASLADSSAADESAAD